MREIKFRAIPKNMYEENVDTTLDTISYYNGQAFDGTFIYGHLNGEYMLGNTIEAAEDYYYPSFWILVDTNTIGQYTELDDIENKEVYEGDLLEDGAEKIWQMKFGTHRRVIPLGASKRIKLVGYGWFLESIDNGDIVPATECQYLKVIGNIHQNKDLLKEGEINE